MRTKTVTRHYCEHCAKGMFKKPSMERHEAACFRNPKRTCPTCNNEPEHTIPEGRREVVRRRLVDCRPKENECPTCFMALCINHNLASGKEGQVWDEWLNYPLEEYKKDRAEFENERRDERTGEMRKKGVL